MTLVFRAERLSRMERKSGKRRDPRYVEQHRDISRWIRVRVVEQFNEQRETEGFLWDITPRAVKIALTSERPLLVFPVGTQTLLTFRIPGADIVTATGTVSRVDDKSSPTAVTATSTVSRLDDFSDKVGMVLYFEFIREADRQRISDICEAYIAHQKKKETF